MARVSSHFDGHGTERSLGCRGLFLFGHPNYVHIDVCYRLPLSGPNVALDPGYGGGPGRCHVVGREFAVTLTTLSRRDDGALGATVHCWVDRE